MTERTTHEGADMPTHPEVVTLDPTNPDDMARLGRAATNADKDDCPRDADFGINVFRLLAAPPLPEEPPLYTVVHVPSLNAWQRWTRLDQPTGRNWVDNRADWSSWEQVCALGTPEVLEPDSVKALRAELSDARERAGRYAADANQAESRAEDFEQRYETSHASRMHAEACYEREHRLSLGFAERASKAEDKAKEWEGKYDAMEIRAEEAELELANLKAQWQGKWASGITPCATEDEPAEPAPVEELADWERALLAEVTEEPSAARVMDAEGIEWHKAEDCSHCWAPESTSSLLHREWRALLEQRGPLTLVETGGQS